MARSPRRRPPRRQPPTYETDEDEWSNKALFALIGGVVVITVLLFVLLWDGFGGFSDADQGPEPIVETLPTESDGEDALSGLYQQAEIVPLRIAYNVTDLAPRDQIQGLDQWPFIRLERANISLLMTEDGIKATAHLEPGPDSRGELSETRRAYYHRERLIQCYESRDDFASQGLSCSTEASPLYSLLRPPGAFLDAPDAVIAERGQETIAGRTCERFIARAPADQVVPDPDAYFPDDAELYVNACFDTQTAAPLEYGVGVATDDQRVPLMRLEAVSAGEPGPLDRAKVPQDVLVAPDCISGVVTVTPMRPTAPLRITVNGQTSEYEVVQAWETITVESELDQGTLETTVDAGYATVATRCTY